jgi:hypothetical protein
MTGATPGDGQDNHCGAIRKGKPPCKRPKGWGTDHPGIGYCKLHGGSTPTHERAAQTEIARRECSMLGVPIETTPADALIHEVREAAGNVAFYRELVQQLATHPTSAERVEHTEWADDGKVEWIPEEPGIYAPTRHVSGIPTGEAKPHILVVLYNDERKHLVAVAAAALRAGVEERRVQMAEADAERIEVAHVRALEAMGLADRLEEFRDEFRAHLAAGREPAHLGATIAA